MAIISDQGIPWRARAINLSEVVGRCNVFFVTYVELLHSKDSSDPIIIGDFGDGSGMGNLTASRSVATGLTTPQEKDMEYFPLAT